MARKQQKGPQRRQYAQPPPGSMKPVTQQTTAGGMNLPVGVVKGATNKKPTPPSKKPYVPPRKGK